jgi:hypothetical protein
VRALIQRNQDISGADHKILFFQECLPRFFLGQGL